MMEEAEELSDRVGIIDHGTGTRDIDRLGNLRHAMPWTAAAALLSASAALAMDASYATPQDALDALAAALATGEPAAVANALGPGAEDLAGAVEEEIDVTVTRLLSKVRTLAAMSYKMSRGHTVVYPRPDLSYCANFLNMMFDSPVKPYEIDDELVEALNVFWILHADHEQNCSTSAVRMVGSGRVNLYAAISAGIAALWGPLHGGANQAVIEMLEDIASNGSGMQHYVDRAKDRQDPFRLMGFGHRVYKS